MNRISQFAVFIALISSAVPSFAETNREGEIVILGDDCGSSGCRPGGITLHIKNREGRVFDIPVARSPYVTADGTILIFPGEKLVVTFPSASDTLGVPHVLATGEAPPAGMPTLTLDYKSDDVTPMMSLSMQNGFAKPIKVDAYLEFPSGGDWKLHYTSTCGLIPKISGFETWSAPLGPIFLGNIRLLPDGNTMSCN